MSWRIAVRHRTGYRYTEPVRASYNEARLTPPSIDGQRTLQAALAITPAVRPLRYVDYWGTTVDAFDVHVPHTELVVLATSLVETAQARPKPVGASWSDLAGPAVQDRFAELLAASSYVPAEPELTEIGRSLRAGSTPVQAGLRAAEWIHKTLRYERGATHVRTSSAEARAAGKGVCQDFAHVTLALLRAVGLPARYVSGYLHPVADAEVGEVTAGESHAWVEFWAGDWVAVDPTSLADVGSRHVLLARGRDYADVRPLSGVYSGSAPEHFGVTVEVTRLG
ncbi:transglutaminase family protein [Nonomuraea sp. NEAU-A123]|uniref:transglutaminase family protein n=1 Tax=Nonomuraea sp. NEAU-A123 TaxID=2839649 RepID=UPI001BE45CAF|nr:transglutaminase family protein [Nonomuraea sp. NEAU-A123]MBT2224967.1 transglutaminase family protein [Nonomuraea sp. NEAU-A123]